MAQDNTLILLALGAGALLLLSKKQASAIAPGETAPGEGSTPDGGTTPPVSPDGGQPGESETGKPQAPSGGFTLGLDPFPALSMALVMGPKGAVWWTKHPASGRWGEAAKDFSPSEGYKSIGMLARNHNVLEVQDTRGNALWKPFVWNAYGYPVGFPLQSFV